MPAEQCLQEAVPGCFVIEFSGHLVQIVTVLSLYDPALQSTEVYFLLCVSKQMANRYYEILIISTNQHFRWPSWFEHTNHFFEISLFSLVLHSK